MAEKSIRFGPALADELNRVMREDGPLIHWRAAHCRCDLAYFDPHDDPACPLRVHPLESWSGVMRRIWWDVRQLVNHRRMAVDQRRRREALR